jgi:hypothetical protein
VIGRFQTQKSPDAALYCRNRHQIVDGPTRSSLLIAKFHVSNTALDMWTGSHPPTICMSFAYWSARMAGLRSRDVRGATTKSRNKNKNKNQRIKRDSRDRQKQ